MSAAVMKRMSRDGQAGFSLLEMLVAVAILSTVAYIALDTVESNTGQTRYELTELRLERIRKAIVGDPNLVANGSPVISGFVADVGGLPPCLDALLNQDPDCNGDGYEDSHASNTGGPVTPPSDYDDLTDGGLNVGLSAGWRGPYLTADPDDGVGDGWGTPAPAAVSDPNVGNFGWRMEEVSGDIDVVSWGRDRASGATVADSYDVDQTMVGITRDDYSVKLRNTSVQVEIVTFRDNSNTTADPPLDTQYCLAMLDIDPSDPTNWRIIPADSDLDGTRDTPRAFSIPLDTPQSNPDTLVFSSLIEIVQGGRPLLVYEVATSATECLNTGDEASLTTATIKKRFGILLSARAPLSASYRVAFEIPES